MKERLPVGFMFKQINNIYEKEFNNLLSRDWDHIVTVCGAGLSSWQQQRICESEGH